MIEKLISNFGIFLDLTCLIKEITYIKLQISIYIPQFCSNHHRIYTSAVKQFILYKIW